MRSKFSAEIIERVGKIKHFALDMDGTIYTGGQLFPCTNPFLNRLTELGIGYSFLTNNPSKSSKDYMSHLDKMGVVTTPDKLYTSAQATIELIQRDMPECKRLFILGTPSMIAEFELAGFESVAEGVEPDALVVGFDMSMVYSRVCCASWWASQGKPYIATNPDRVCPTDKPTVLVDCGSITTMIAHATGREPDVVVGKPDPRMLLGLMAKYGYERDEIAMVGDRIYTDVQMAFNVGALGVLVLSGETKIETALSAERVPDLIVDDIGELERLILESRR